MLSKKHLPYLLPNAATSWRGHTTLATPHKLPLASAPTGVGLSREELETEAFFLTKRVPKQFLPRYLSTDLLC